MANMPNPSDYTARELADMRAWIDDCMWWDLIAADMTAADLTDQEVVTGVQRHYVGGLRQFRIDGLEADLPL